MDKIEPNLPFERIPQCGCDLGVGAAPTKLKRMECRLRGGPCSPHHARSPEADIPA